MNSRTANTLARRAFSLMELVLVLAILGVLMAVAAYNFAGAGERAKIKATKISLGVIRDAVKQYHLEKSAYPPDLNTLIAMKYLDEDRGANDGWGRPIYYVPNAAYQPGGTMRPFDLVSAGPDQQFNTPDDIDVWTMEMD